MLLLKKTAVGITFQLASGQVFVFFIFFIEIQLIMNSPEES